VAQARIAAEQLLATQASTSSGFDHGITGLQVPMEDPNDAENCAVGRGCVSLRGDSHRHFHPHRCQHGIVISIPATAENRSRSRWNRCSRSSGIRVHDALETAFTIDRNMQSGPSRPRLVLSFATQRSGWRSSETSTKPVRTNFKGLWPRRLALRRCPTMPGDVHCLPRPVARAAANNRFERSRGATSVS
jgi:hypothetical protein